MTPLDHKLIRDLGRIKAQAAAIAVVIALGVMMLVMMSGLVLSLDETRRAYYERYRLADIFAQVTRAPERLVKKLEEIQGVSNVQSRVFGSALIALPDQDLPLQAIAISLPDTGKPLLNDVYLTGGRYLSTGHQDEIILLESFAKAHDLVPGDTLSATMNGARRQFQIVGVAQSPEFLYTTPPGELMPDDSRFGVIWIGQKALATAYDLEGAFNEVLLSLGHRANLPQVLASIDRILEPYGGAGAYGIEDQLSNRFVSEEIANLRNSAKVVPPIFLAVAAFLLNIVVSRIVQSEREQIGLLKAFGYSNIEVGSHYFKLVLLIAIGGATFGSLLGIFTGRWLIQIYTLYFKFPFLVFQLEASTFFTGYLVSVAASSAGGLWVLRHVFALTPAVAMRPPAPPNYSRSSRISGVLNRLLDQPSRMVLRRLTRQPIRMAGAIIGVASGMALSSAMLTIYGGFDRTIDLTFNVVDRSDVTVTFTRPLDIKSAFALKQMHGIVWVEPTRIVPAILRNGLRTYRGAVNGLEPDARLNRAISKDLSAIDLTGDGIVLSSGLANILDIGVGEILTVDVREGRQPQLEIPVVAISETLLGSPAYMNREALNRAMREPNRISGAYLSIDKAKAAPIYRALKDMPTVAGVSLKEDTRKAMVKMMDTGAGAMRYVMGIIAFTITFGIIYNAARIAYAERARDLAGLRVIGFTRGEAAFVLLGELVVVVLIAMPLGGAISYYLARALAEGFSTELYQITTVFSPEAYGSAAMFVLLATLASGLLVKRDLDRADLVAVLKSQE
ncbi:ABC transporter permease [Falsihalocynthiibacter sp. BN13B15]|uniref:ABC transporter permease n=1 Tax=Falsihalocynthiibacter sp. BN13B15 TaxID=3240871 RepID=UPI003510A2AD